MNEQIKINWYRCTIDRAVLSELMKRNDAKAFAQAAGHLLFYAATGTSAYLAYGAIHASTRLWAVPLLLLALFAHGTVGSFLGGVAGHELCHKTPFSNPKWNAFFLRIYAFLAWFDPVGYRASHIRHHQATVYADHDGEVVLPQGLDWHGIRFVLGCLTFKPTNVVKNLKFWVHAARGRFDQDGFFKSAWLRQVIPESNVEQRREIVSWARVILFGHSALAALFLLTGNWILIPIVNLGPWYCDWLGTLCAAPQHVGLSPNVPDFRLNTRTYTCGFLPAFLYWNMQYHVEHHMFPAVPFYNLGRLRQAIAQDLPPAPHGLWATWQELLPIMRRQREDPAYVFLPVLPRNEGKRVSDQRIEAEAAQRGAQ